MKKITYTINVKDIVAKFDECKYVKVEFYADGNFDILDDDAYGYPEELTYILHFQRADFEECDNNIDTFYTWVASGEDEVVTWDAFDEPQYTISINWTK